MPESLAPATIDVRAIPPRERHATLFAMLRSLAVEESLELVNDHAPRPLFHQLQQEAPGQFRWEYLQEGPDTWRVRIARQAAAQGHGPCCGGCGGA